MLINKRSVKFIIIIFMVLLMAIILILVVILIGNLYSSSSSQNLTTITTQVPPVLNQNQIIRNQYHCRYFEKDGILLTLSADNTASGYEALKEFCLSIPACEWRAIYKNNYTCCPTDLDDYDNFRKNLMKNLKYPEEIYRRCTAIIY